MPGLEPGPHVDLLQEALAIEADGHRALLAGGQDAPELMERAAGRYLASYDCAPPASYGRLVGALKAAVLGGGGQQVAAGVLERLAGDPPGPTAGYARAVALMVLGEDGAAGEAIAAMRAGDGAFHRAADALAALAARDVSAYRSACAAIVADFATRPAHLTGVPIADTAAMLEVLAAERGMACAPASPLMPSR